MSDHNVNPDGAAGEFESLIPEGEFPFPSPTFERLMNTPVRQREDDDRQTIARIVDEYFRQKGTE